CRGVLGWLPLFAAGSRSRFVALSFIRAYEYRDAGPGRKRPLGSAADRVPARASRPRTEAGARPGALPRDRVKKNRALARSASMRDAPARGAAPTNAAAPRRRTPPPGPGYHSDPARPRP